MLNSALNYPYPLLRKLAVDYKSSTFSADLNKYNRKNGFEVKIQYHLNNLQISKMIDDKLLAYAVQIQCVSTWYRKLKISTADTDSVFLPSGLVHERVELCPCIIALKDIQKFDNEDFSDDFDGISFSLNKGEVVAIGEREKFDAYYKKDILKTGDTILHVNQDKKAELMHQEFDSDIIQVYLPENQYKMYTTIGENEKWKIPALNATIAVPVIVQAIKEISESSQSSGSTFEQYAWYKTLVFLMQRAVKDDDRKYRKLLNDPLRTAELLLNDNSAQTLKLLSRVSSLQGRGE